MPPIDPDHAPDPIAAEAAAHLASAIDGLRSRLARVEAALAREDPRGPGAGWGGHPPDEMATRRHPALGPILWGAARAGYAATREIGRHQHLIEHHPGAAREATRRALGALAMALRECLARAEAIDPLSYRAR